MFKTSRFFYPIPPLKFSMSPRIALNSYRWLLCGLMLSATAGQALAALGQAPTPLTAASSVQSQTSNAQKRALASVASVASSGLYTVHENQLANGTAVREFATLDGVVFAVSWRGPVLPDLSGLLGSYFDAFKLEVDLARTAGKRGGPVIIRNNDLVVISNGRMRHFFGYAYAPAIVPVNINIHDILQ
jgi:hypothetical protein